MVLLEFSISPTGKGESLSPYIARVLKIVDDSGLPYQLTSMGTIIEGEWNEVFKVVTDCFHELESDCSRIGVHIKVDYRAGKTSRMESKVKSVEQKIGFPLKYR